MEHTRPPMRYGVELSATAEHHIFNRLEWFTEFEPDSRSDSDRTSGLGTAVIPLYKAEDSNTFFLHLRRARYREKEPRNVVSLRELTTQYPGTGLKTFDEGFQLLDLDLRLKITHFHLYQYYEGPNYYFDVASAALKPALKQLYDEDIAYNGVVPEVPVFDRSKGTAQVEAHKWHIRTHHSEAPQVILIAEAGGEFLAEDVKDCLLQQTFTCSVCSPSIELERPLVDMYPPGDQLLARFVNIIPWKLVRPSRTLIVLDAATNYVWVFMVHPTENIEDVFRNLIMRNSLAPINVPHPAVVLTPENQTEFKALYNSALFQSLDIKHHTRRYAQYADRMDRVVEQLERNIEVSLNQTGGCKRFMWHALFYAAWVFNETPTMSGEAPVDFWYRNNPLDKTKPILKWIPFGCNMWHNDEQEDGAVPQEVVFLGYQWDEPSLMARVWSTRTRRAFNVHYKALTSTLSFSFDISHTIAVLNREKAIEEDDKDFVYSWDKLRGLLRKMRRSEYASLLPNVPREISTLEVRMGNQGSQLPGAQRSQKRSRGEADVSRKRRR